MSLLQVVAPPPAVPPERPPGGKTPVAPGAYAGTDACRPCHAAKVATYLSTAHQKTSSLGTKETVAGRFDAGSNVLTTANPRLSFRMETRPDGLYQVALMAPLAGGAAPAPLRAERIDIVTGSGRKGQTYLFWKGEQLFELPVSYWTDQHKWVNSPGFRNGDVNFTRVITPRCLECHATYVEHKAGTIGDYERNGFVAGIGCEKCHGPGRDHIARQRSAAKAPIAHDVVNTGRLPRERQLDLCATCHSGGTLATAPAFSYVPGEPLSDYFTRSPIAQATAAEVHGNQVALLRGSKCFQGSSTMTCSTCHDVHAPQRDVAALASKCLTCHKPEACGVFPKAGARITTRCIGCHMPNSQSGVITVTASSDSMRPSVRNHFIKVYPEESAAILKTLVAQ